MAQVLERAEFVLEAQHGRGLERAQRLQCDARIVLAIENFVDHASAAGAELTNDLEPRIARKDSAHHRHLPDRIRICTSGVVGVNDGLRPMYPLPVKPTVGSWGRALCSRVGDFPACNPLAPRLAGR